MNNHELRGLDDDLSNFLHGERDAEAMDRLADAARGEVSIARSIQDELEFSELLRQGLIESKNGGVTEFSDGLASSGLSLEELLYLVREGSASRFECDQVAKAIWNDPAGILVLKQSLIYEERLEEAFSDAKSGEAFVEALETRMWAETSEDHFVEDFTLRLEQEFGDEKDDTIVAFPGSWTRAILQVASVAAAIVVGAFFVGKTVSGVIDQKPVVASVVKSSSDAVWAFDSRPGDNGELSSGRYQLDSGVVSLKFVSGSEMTVEAPALFDVSDDASAQILKGVALTRTNKTDTGLALRSRGITISNSVPLIGIDARSEYSTDAIVFEGDGGICLTEGGVCRELFPMEAVKADFSRERLVDIPYNPHAFTKTWELLSGVEKNLGSVRIELPGSEIGPAESVESEVQVYVENESFRPEEDLEVDEMSTGQFASAVENDGQNLQASGDLRSYLLQLWPTGDNAGEEVEASLTFDHPVVGIIYTSDRLGKSDGSVGSSITHVGEEFNSERGLDLGNDLILLSEDRKTLNLRLRGDASQIDQVRVLVALN